MLKRLVALVCLLLLSGFSCADAQVYVAKPKLVIELVIDQFRGDYLDRFRDSFTAANGFNLFLKKGAYFANCYYDYANTKTAPGHATIGTGAYTDGHGINSNEWWDLSRNTDRVISSVEDERYRIVGASDEGAAASAQIGAQIGASPLNLRATTLGDEVRLGTGGQSRVFGVSLKDRASILPSGQAANAAYWIDASTGRFITSSYYMPQLPAWVAAFDKGPRIAQAVKDAGLAKTTKFYSQVGGTPAANSYELDFARALIENEKLGTGGTTDVLTLSLSANDIVGHAAGPDSPEEKQMILGLDRDLDSFFTWLDQQVGLANVIVSFTADHGVAPVPAQAAKLGIAATMIDLHKLISALDDSLNQRLSPGNNKHYFMPTQELPYLQLDARAFGKLSEREAEDDVAEALPAALRSLGPPSAPPNNKNTSEATRHYEDARVAPLPTFALIRSRVDLADGRLPPTELGRMIAHSYSPNGGWYVMAVPAAYQMESINMGTTHFSPWSYDRHVPLGFFGAEFRPGYYREPVAPVDIAATLASLLAVNRPSAAVGQVLTFALASDAAGRR